MEIIMRKWYAFLSGKKMLGIGLGAVVALTALLAVNFYREQNDRYVTTNGSEALTQAEQANKTQSDGMPSEANQVAEEITPSAGAKTASPGFACTIIAGHTLYSSNVG